MLELTEIEFKATTLEPERLTKGPPETIFIDPDKARTIPPIEPLDMNVKNNSEAELDIVELEPWTKDAEVSARFWAAHSVPAMRVLPTIVTVDALLVFMPLPLVTTREAADTSE